MKAKELIKLLKGVDPEAVCAFANDSYGLDTRFYEVKNVVSDEGVFCTEGSGPDHGWYDCLTEWRDLKEMEDFYGATDNDPLAFVSLVVLS